MFATLFLIKYYEMCAYKYLFLAGLCVGLAFFSRQPLGLLLPFFAGFLFFSNFNYSCIKSSIKNACFNIAIFCLGFGVVCFMVILYLFANNSLYDFFMQNFVFARTVFRFTWQTQFPFKPIST